MRGLVRFLFVLLFFGPISPHELLFFHTGDTGEAEIAGTGDWSRPGLQPDLGRWSAFSALCLRARCIAAERVRGVRLSCRPRAAGAAGTRRARRPRLPRCRAAEGRPCDPSGPVEQRGTPRDDRRWRCRAAVLPLPGVRRLAEAEAVAVVLALAVTVQKLS